MKIPLEKLQINTLGADVFFTTTTAFEFDL